MKLRVLIVHFFAFIFPLMVFAQEGEKGPGLLVQLFPFIAMFFIFYLLVMRPQVKKQKKHHEFLTALKRGDDVLTGSGIFGTIEGITDKFVVLQVADGVKIRVLKSQIAQPIKEG